MFAQTQVGHGSVGFHPAARTAKDDVLGAIGTIVSVAKGRALYGEGSKADAWYQVRSGMLRTAKLLSDGRRQIDAFLLAGDFFGFETASEHSFSAEAVSDAIVVRLSRQRVEALIEDNARVGRQVMNIMLKQLSTAHDHMLRLGRKSAEEKLASFIIEMMDRSGSNRRVALPMSRTDIGDYLGLTIETVSRTVSQFRKDGLIALPNPQALEVRDRVRLGERAGD